MTCGKIRGLVKCEDLLEFIKERWDKQATCSISKEIICEIKECDFEYKINEHSTDKENWYNESGLFFFKYNGERKLLFYLYSNLNCLDSSEFYSEYGLWDMLLAEKSTISLNYTNDSVDIITEIVKHFGGGWINDKCLDDMDFYVVEK